MATLQQQVQQHLQNTGMSIQDFAKQAGIGKSTVAQVASGRSNPSFATRRKLEAAIRDYKPKTIHDKVEDIAADRVECDVMTRDDALECGKQRRIEALEAEVSVWRGKEHKACEQAHNLQDVLERREQNLKSCENALIEAHVRDTDLECAKYRRVMALEKELEQSKAEVGIVREQREQHLKSCENALIEANEKIQNVLDESGKQLADLSLQLYGANAEIKRLTALSDTLFAERDNMRTEYEYSLMRLRVRCFALVCAIVFLIVSGLVLWGAV